MDKFDIKSAKYVSLVIFICIVFILVVAHAFKYLPNMTEQELNSVRNEEQVEILDEQNSNNEEEIVKNESNNYEQNHNSFNTQEMISTSNNIEELETINDEASEISSFEKKEETTEDIIKNAKKYTSEKQYSKALSEYQRILAQSTETKIKGDCYEGMSLIYAMAKRYGTALSYAQKAYNIAPTTAREVLLARLYYKTGDVEKAEIRMRNVLKRDFSMDN